jgi:hypothetical protein
MKSPFGRQNMHDGFWQEELSNTRSPVAKEPGKTTATIPFKCDIRRPLNPLDGLGGEIPLAKSSTLNQPPH